MEIIVIICLIALLGLTLYIAGAIPLSIELSVSLDGACINKPVMDGNISMMNYSVWLWQFRRWRAANQDRVDQIVVYRPTYSVFWYAEAGGFQYFHSSAAKAKRVIAARMFVADKTNEKAS